MHLNTGTSCSLQKPHNSHANPRFACHNSHVTTPTTTDTSTTFNNTSSKAQTTPNHPHQHPSHQVSRSRHLSQTNSYRKLGQILSSLHLHHAQQWPPICPQYRRGLPIYPITHTTITLRYLHRPPQQRPQLHWMVPLLQLLPQVLPWYHRPYTTPTNMPDVPTTNTNK